MRVYCKEDSAFNLKHFNKKFAAKFRQLSSSWLSNQINLFHTLSWITFGNKFTIMKNSTSIVLQKCQSQVSFQRKGSGIVLKFSFNFLKGRTCSLMNKEHYYLIYFTCRFLQTTSSNSERRGGPTLDQLHELVLILCILLSLFNGHSQYTSNLQPWIPKVFLRSLCK